MSLAEDAQALLFVADYVALDASGKVNALGLAFNLCPITAQGVTPPHMLFAVVDVPRKHAGETASICLELKDRATGQTVALPGPTGAQDAVRIQQLVRFEAPSSPPGAMISDDVGCRWQGVLAFSNGLPLVPGHSYDWRLEVDGQKRKGWVASFHVLAPQPGPVIGGTAGPAPTGLPPLDDTLEE